MPCSLSSLRKSLRRECSVTITEITEPELQMYLDRWGISSGKVNVRCGPWGSFILRSNHQEVALSPVLARQLQVETVN